MGAALVELLNKEKSKSVTVNAYGHEGFLAEGMDLGNYKYLKYISDEKARPSLTEAYFLNISEEKLKEMKIRSQQ